LSTYGEERRTGGGLGQGTKGKSKPEQSSTGCPRGQGSSHRGRKWKIGERRLSGIGDTPFLLNEFSREGGGTCSNEKIGPVDDDNPGALLYE